jgi:hypothetical protein
VRAVRSAGRPGRRDALAYFGRFGARVRYKLSMTTLKRYFDGTGVQARKAG